MFFIHVTGKKNFKKITTDLNGTYSLFGTLKFQYKNLNFKLIRIGTGNINSGFGGSYPSIYLEAPDRVNFFLGPKESYKFIALGKIKESYLPFIINDENNLRNFILQSETLKDSEFLINLINGDRLLQAEIGQLLSRDFQFIKSVRRFEISGFKIKRNHFINLSFLSHDIFNDPGKLRNDLDKFLFVLLKLRIVSM